MVKKNKFDICAGDCKNCAERGIKNLSLLTLCTKRKVVTKYVPPDMAAIKLLLEKRDCGIGSVQELSDEELALLEKELEEILKNSHQREGL